jgi:hypothetical protein
MTRMIGPVGVGSDFQEFHTGIVQGSNLRGADLEPAKLHRWPVQSPAHSNHEAWQIPGINRSGGLNCNIMCCPIGRAGRRVYFMETTDAPDGGSGCAGAVSAGD